MTMNKKEQRLRRARQTRARIAIQGAARLTVFRSNSHIYASVISGCGTKVWLRPPLPRRKCAPSWVPPARVVPPTPPP